MSTTPSHSPLSWQEGRRRRAWELHQLGWSQHQIALALGVTQGAVRQWRARAAGDGVDALRAHPAPGPRPKRTAAPRAQLPALLARGAPAFGFRGAVWTRRRVARLIHAQFGVRYHPTQVGRRLRDWGWSVQTPVQRATQRDEAAIAVWYDTRWPAIKKKPGVGTGPSSG